MDCCICNNNSSFPFFFSSGNLKRSTFKMYYKITLFYFFYILFNFYIGNIFCVSFRFSNFCNSGFMKDSRNLSKCHLVDHLYVYIYLKYFVSNAFAIYTMNVFFKKIIQL